MLLRRHRADDTVTKAIARVLRADLVVVDDIGLLPVAPDAAEGLYRLVDAAYEKRSIALSSNLHPAGFDELMPKTLATATVDRLLHHAHLCRLGIRVQRDDPEAEELALIYGAPKGWTQRKPSGRDDHHERDGRSARLLDRSRRRCP